MNISEIPDFINKNPWLNIVFIAFSLLGITLSIFFFVKGKKLRRPTFLIRTINLIKEKINKIESVEILYQGNKIDNLSVSKIAIWNAGSETISSSDIAQNDKFRIEIDGNNQILDYELLFQKNKANGFELYGLNSKTINIDFDYFDINEGAIIQIYHTATDSSSLNILGSVKGASRIQRSENRVLPRFINNVLDSVSLSSKLTFRILGIVTLIIPILFLLPILLPSPSISLKDNKTTKSIFFALSITIPYWWLGFKMLKRKVPKGFNLFDDEF